MELLLLEIFEHRVYLLVHRHKVWLTNKTLPTELIALGDVGKQILHKQHALDIVDILVVDRQARIARIGNHPLHLGEGHCLLHRLNIDTRAHDILHFARSDTYNTRQYLLLFALGLGGHIHSVGQLLNRDILATRSRHLANSTARIDQNVGEWRKQPTQNNKRLRKEQRHLHIR